MICNGTPPARYTIHLQKYGPPPDARLGMERLAVQLKGSTATIVLRGNPSGFEDDIKVLKETGINVEDLTFANPV